MSGRNNHSRDHGSVSSPSRLDQFADIGRKEKMDTVRDKKTDCTQK
jgi:hypothetical protein